MCMIKLTFNVLKNPSHLNNISEFCDTAKHFMESVNDDIFKLSMHSSNICVIQ